MRPGIHEELIWLPLSSLFFYFFGGPNGEDVETTCLRDKRNKRDKQTRLAHVALHTSTGRPPVLRRSTLARFTDSKASSA